MRKMVMQTAEPVSTIKDTERLFKTLDGTYSKSYIKQVADKKNPAELLIKNSDTKAPQRFRGIV